LITAASLQIAINAQGAQQATADLRGVGNAVETTGQQAQTGGQRFGAAGQVIRGVGLGLTASVTAPILALGTGIVGMASDSNEALSAVTTVYGSAAQTVIDTSRNAATAVGMSQTQYLSATTQLAAYGNMMGLTEAQTATFADQTVTAAADLASFYNTSPEDALGAITAGLRGEGDALERYGIIMNQATVEAYALEQGIWDGNGAMTTQQLETARSGFIMSQLTDETGSANAAQGDFARTSGGLANQQRILKAELKDVAAQFGQVLLPIALKMVGGFQKVIGVMADMSPHAKAITVVIAGIAAAVGPALVVIGSMMGPLANGFRVARIAMLAVTGPIGLIVAALVGLGIAYKTNFLGFGDAVRAVGSTVKDAFNGIVDEVTGFIDRFKNAFNFFSSGGVMTPIHDLAGNMTTAFRAVTQPMQVVESVIHALAAAIRGIGGGDIPFFASLAGWLDRIAPQVQSFVDQVQAAWDWLGNIFSSGNAEAGLSQFSGALQPIMHGLGKLVDTAHDLSAAWSKGGFMGVIRAIPSELRDVRDAFSLIFRGIGQAITNVTRDIPIVGTVVRTLGKVFTWVGETVDTLTNAFRYLRERGANPVQAAVFALSQAFPGLRDVFVGVYVVGEQLIGVLTGLWDAFSALLRGDWSGVFDGLQDAWSALLGTLGTAADVIGTLLLDAFNAIPWGTIGSALKTGFTAAWSVLKAGATNLWDWLTDKLGAIDWSALVSSVRSALEGVWQGIQSGLELAWDAITNIDWSAFIPALEWVSYVASLAWDAFVDGVLKLADFITDLDWGAFISGAVDVGTRIASFAWDTVITGAVAIADFITSLDWGAFISGTIAIAQYVSTLAWSAFVTGIVNVVDFITSLDWAGFVSGAVDVATYIAKLSWSAFVTGAVAVGGYIASLDWGAFISGTVDVSTKIGSFLWSTVISGSVAVGTYIASLDWASFISGTVSIVSYISSLAWSSFVTGIVNVVDFIKSLDWGSFVSGAIDVTTYIAALAWTTFVTGAVAVGDYIASLDWGSFISGTVDVATKIAAFAWSTVISGSVAIASYIASLDWGAFISGSISIVSYISSLAWSSFITGIVNVVDFIKSLDWGSFVSGAIDVATYIAKLAWSSFISGAVKLIDYVTSINWGDFVPDLSWPAIPAFSWPGVQNIVDAIPWPDIPSFSWPSKDEILSAILGILPDISGITSAVKDPIAGWVPPAGGMTPEQIQGAQDAWNNRSHLGGSGGGNKFAGQQMPDFGSLGGGSDLFATFIEQANTAKTAFAEVMTGIKTGSETMKTGVVAALTGMATESLPQVTGLSTLSAGEFAKLHASGLLESTGLGVDVKTRFADMQLGASGSATALNAGVSASLGAMKGTGLGHVNALSSQSLGSFASLKTGATSAASTTSSDVVAKLGTMSIGGAQKAAEMMTGVKNNISNSGAADKAYSVGVNVGAGLRDGLASMQQEVGAYAAALISQVDGAMRKKAMIRSPSQMTQAIGSYLGKGLIVGLDSTVTAVGASATAMIGTVESALKGLGGVRDIVAAIDSYAGSGPRPTGRGNFFANLQGADWRQSASGADLRTTTNLTDTMKVIGDSLAAVLQGGEWNSDVLAHLPNQMISELTRQIGKALAPFEGQANVFESTFRALKNLIATGSDKGAFANVFDPVEADLIRLADMLRSQFGGIAQSSLAAADAAWAQAQKWMGVGEKMLAIGQPGAVTHDQYFDFKRTNGYGPQDAQAASMMNDQQLALLRSLDTLQGKIEDGGWDGGAQEKAYIAQLAANIDSLRRDGFKVSQFEDYSATVGRGTARDYSGMSGFGQTVADISRVASGLASKYGLGDLGGFGNQLKALVGQNLGADQLRAALGPLADSARAMFAAAAGLGKIPATMGPFEAIAASLKDGTKVTFEEAAYFQPWKELDGLIRNLDRGVSAGMQGLINEATRLQAFIEHPTDIVGQIGKALAGTEANAQARLLEIAKTVGGAIAEDWSLILDPKKFWGTGWQPPTMASTPVASTPAPVAAPVSTSKPQNTYTLTQYNTMTVSVKDAEEMVRLSRFVNDLPTAMSLVFGGQNPGGAY